MIVQGMPTQNSLRFWVSKDEGKENAVLKNVNKPVVENLSVKDLELNNGELIGYLFSAGGLSPGTQYIFTVNNQKIECATLPNSINEIDLTISLGSCYWFFSKAARDLANIPLTKEHIKPVFRFLAGDQIYNDCFGTSDIENAAKMPKPFENYSRQWNEPYFQQFFSKTPNAVLADDHEFWNNYPHYNIYQFIWQNPLTEKKVLKLEQDCLAAFNAYQRPLNPNGALCFSVEFNELSFFVLDTRISRTHYKDAAQPHFILPAEKTRLEQWILGLKTPGVIVISGLLADSKSGMDVKVFRAGDFSLADYGSDYFDLWNAVIDSPHDVLILGGDVHYNRFGYVDTEKNRTSNASRNGKVYECVCSSLCVLDSAKSRFNKHLDSKHDERKFDFDISGSLKKRIKKTYQNIFPHTDWYNESTCSYALLSFKALDEGVEFTVTYYDSRTGDSLMKDSSVNRKNILY